MKVYCVIPFDMGMLGEAYDKPIEIWSSLEKALERAKSLNLSLRSGSDPVLLPDGFKVIEYVLDDKGKVLYLEEK